MQNENYTVGDHDTRPWGSYRVTAVGADFCEKEIIVKPRQILSLQSHDHRAETWTVVRGPLTALVNDQIHTLPTGRSVKIPLGALHCMANMTNEDVVVHERQEGQCRENDIHRYHDAYGRSDSSDPKPEHQHILILYKSLIEKTKF